MTDIRALPIAATLQPEGLAQTCVAQAAQALLTPASVNKRIVDVLARRAKGREVFHRSVPAEHLDREALALQLIRYFDTQGN